jgi:hypothetical protein
MHLTSLIAGVLVAGSLAAAHGPDGPSKTTKRIEIRAEQATVTSSVTVTDRTKLANYHSDMHSLHSKVRADPLYTSMKDVLKTAVPESYRDALKTNPSSVHKAFETQPPDWYKKLPKDVKSFMEKNHKEAKSVYEKDMGPVATKAADKKSEAAPSSIIGATVFALVGAFGVAALLL